MNSSILNVTTYLLTDLNTLIVTVISGSDLSTTSASQTTVSKH